MKNIVRSAAIAALLASAITAPVAAQAEELAPAKPDSTVEWEGTPYVTDTTQTNNRLRTLSTEEKIIDVSKWQGSIDWSKVAKTVDFAIIRTQYGSSVEDTLHKTYEKNAIANNVPFGVYSYSLAVSTSDARTEARNFYNRANKNAKMYVIDVEEMTSTSGESMRKVINAYVDELRKYTDKKIGLYIAHHLYTKLNLDTSKADFVWIPRYGSTAPSYTYDLWQYTDRGIVSGISGYVDMNRLKAGKDLSDISGKSDMVTQTGSDIDYSKYYTATNKPAYIQALKDVDTFKSTALTAANKNGTLQKNDVVKVIGIVNSASGYPRLKIGTNKYVTASKSMVQKIVSSYDSYYYTNPDQVLFKKNAKIYSSTTMDESTEKGTSYTAGTVADVLSIAYSNTGVPRLKTTRGYVTANKNMVQQAKSGINYNNFHFVNPGYVQVLSDLVTYKSTSFTAGNKNGTVAAGKVVKVTGIAFSNTGYPRLKIGTNKYINANKVYAQKIVSSYDNYYYTNPKKIVVKKEASIFNDTTMNSSTATGKSYDIGDIVTVTGIAFSDTGVPRLITEDGYISSNKNMVQKVVSSIDNYITTVPAKALSKTTVWEYNSTNFDTSNRYKSYKVNHVFTITGIEYTSGGTPRLKTSTGKYITANKANVQNVAKSITSYYYGTNVPSNLTLAKATSQWKTVNLTGKVKDFAAGTVVSIKEIGYSDTGYPRFQLTDGTYITANKVNFK